MIVELRVFGDLRPFIPERKLGEPHPLELEDNSNVKNVLVKLQIPETLAKIIMINGRPESLDDKLYDGDRLALFPAIAGG